MVFGGTNVYGHGDAPLGRMSDREPDTFYGAMHTLCRKILERYPEAQPVIITPLYRSGENAAVNEIGVRHAGSLEAYVCAEQQVAAYYGIPVLDLYRTGGFQPGVDVLRKTYMPDGLHPNDAGHLRIARRLTEFLKAL